MFAKYLLICLVLLTACQQEAPKAPQQEVEVSLSAEKILEMCQQIQNSPLKVRQKPYLSPATNTSGRLTLHEKDGVLLRLQDENQTPDGQIITNYYYLPSGKLFFIDKRNIFQEKKANSPIHVQQTEMFFNEGNLFKIIEKRLITDEQTPINWESMPSMELKIEGDILQSKSKRHNQEATQMVFFAYSEKNYDDFFDTP